MKLQRTAGHFPIDNKTNSYLLVLEGVTFSDSGKMIPESEEAASLFYCTAQPKLKKNYKPF